MPSLPPPSKKTNVSLFDDDDDGWQDMPVVRKDDFVSDLDAVDREKYKYRTSVGDGDVGAASSKTAASATTTNATGNLIDFDDRGNEWRVKNEVEEGEYTRLKLEEEEDGDDVHLRTKYLFDEDKAMTPLGQMQTTKNMLTDAQRIAYVGVCQLVAREMLHDIKRLGTAKELRPAAQQMELWGLKIMGRLYYHMELETAGERASTAHADTRVLTVDAEQKMIESLAEHGVQALDLIPSLMTTRTVANPEYDPAQAKAKADERAASTTSHDTNEDDDDNVTLCDAPLSPTSAQSPKSATHASGGLVGLAKPVLTQSEKQTLPGVSTTLDATDENVTLDIRWTVLCDLFLCLIADSVYDARSRVLLERVADKLSLGWVDVVKFERRITEALEIQEGVEKMEQKDVIEGRIKVSKRRRYAMVGLATLGGGLVIGLSAGLLAPVIGAALGGVLTTIGVSGTTGFLAGAGGAAVITTGGVLTGSGIAAKGMARRTLPVNTFNLIPLHNNKRVNCIVTVAGFMNGLQDDVRLPFSVLDPLVGDVFSVLWEPEMMNEMGNALKILTTEVLTTVGQTVLQATVLTAVMSAIQWPLILTKLGYLIDNPWSNALDRACSAGQVLADILMQRHLGVRPISLIGYSLGARVIFYCLVELSKRKAMGIVQDVFLFGATITAPTRTWVEVRSVVAGRFVNGFARSDWVLNYLFRATSASLNAVAGLRPIENVPGLENVDVTDKIAGHASYRTYMPLILHQVGFPVTADYFDEPENVDDVFDRVLQREEETEAKAKKGWFSRKPKKQKTSSISRPPTASSFPRMNSGDKKAAVQQDDELPAREAHPVASQTGASSTQALSGNADVHEPSPSSGGSEDRSSAEPKPSVPLRAGFDFSAIHDMLDRERGDVPPPGKDATPLTPPHKLVGPTIDRTQSSIGHHAQEPVSSSFQRSLSLETGRRASWSQPSGNDDEDELRTPRPAAPTLSFGGSDGTVWPAQSTSAPRWGDTASTSKNPFASSTLSFGAVDGSITTTNASPPTNGPRWTPPANPWG